MARRLEMSLLMALVMGVAACERGSVGGDPPQDGAPPVDGIAPPTDGVAPPADAYVPGCEPQDAQEDPAVFCDECAYCDDLLPWQWDGDECLFAPTCCGCAGADCDQRFRTFTECEQEYGSCPHALFEVAYPDGRLLLWMPGGAAGHGPMLNVNGYGELQTWLYVSNFSDPGPPDYTEQLSLREANQLFTLLSSVDFTDLPHPPLDGFECYPTLWLWWDPAHISDPIVLDYPRASSLLPEMEEVYAFFDRLLCRSDGIPGYPETLPSEYCMWW